MRNLAIVLLLLFSFGCGRNDDDCEPREVIVEQEVIVEKEVVVDRPVSLCEMLDEGLVEVDSTFEAMVYPNPSRGEFNVGFDAEQSGRAAIRMIDVTGKQLFCNTYSVNSGNTEVKMLQDHLPSGVYILQVYNDGRMASVKVVFN